MTELPMLIVNVQRGGPSTGLPTKTEQADLYQAIWGRNSECPIPVLAASTPADCFHLTLEGMRMAVRYMTPVDSAHRWISRQWGRALAGSFLGRAAQDRGGYAEGNGGAEKFRPYDRDEKTLARPWAIPGTKGLEHRIGGLEKQNGSGDVSYDPENHQVMVNLRAEKVARIADDIPLAELNGPRGS